MVDNSEDMSVALNYCFLLVFTHENLTTLPGADQVFRGRKDKRLTNINITSQYVIQEIYELRINKSPGVDQVFPRVLKKCKNTISVALTDIFNKSIASGDLVSSLRIQENVIPIFKNGDKSVMSNYQPISLTSVICKMLVYYFHESRGASIELH